MNGEYNSQKGFTRSGCFTIALAFGIVFSALGIYIFVCIVRYIHTADEISKDYYCRAAQLPSYASCVDRMSIVEFKGIHNYKSLESRKYRNEEKLIESLPDGFSYAVTNALGQGEAEEAADIKNKPVMRYQVSEDLLPLEDSGYDDDIECYYFVLVYPDGSCRFDIISEKTGPDY